MGSSELVGVVRSLSGLIDDWVAFQRWYRQVPGIAVGIGVGDEVVLATGHGMADLERGLPVTATTRFRIASHSKVFTTTAIMQLVEQGRLRLDDRVADHLDWFAPEAGTDDERAHITVRHLLTHSSGLTRDGTTTHWHTGRFPSLDELVASVADMPVFGTVEHLKYSNIAFTLAGQVIESVTGRSYEEHLTEAIVEPLGLSATTPDLPDDLSEHAVGYPRFLPGRDRPPFDHAEAGAMNSATGFSSNVVDLLRWYQAHRPGSGELLHDRSKREMQRVQFEDLPMRWGLGFSVASHGKRRFATHGGGYPGFITYSGVEPATGLSIVVLTNAADGPARPLFDGIVRLIDLATGGRFDGDAPFDADAADQLTGFYEHVWGVEQVARVGSKMVTLDPVQADPLLALSVLEHEDGWTFRQPTTHAMDAPGERVSFDPGSPPTLVSATTMRIDRADGLLEAGSTS